MIDLDNLEEAISEAGLFNGYNGCTDSESKLIWDAARAYLNLMRSDKWKVVPVEATPEIIEAILDNDSPYVCRKNKSNHITEMYEVAFQPNEDWRECITEFEVIAKYPTHIQSESHYDDVRSQFKYSDILSATPTYTGEE